MAVTDHPAYDYVVVGSGAGGGTVAARLAEAGMRVFLIEAGGDPRALQGGDPLYPLAKSPAGRLRRPRLPRLRHGKRGDGLGVLRAPLRGRCAAAADPKYRREYEGAPVDGVLYPRAGALGGCTTHNAMVIVYPHKRRLGPHRRADGRRVLARDRRCAAISSGSRIAAITGSTASSPARPQPPRHGWKRVAAGREGHPRSALGDVDMQHGLERSALRASRKRAIRSISSLGWSRGWPTRTTGAWSRMPSGCATCRWPPASTRARHARAGAGGAQKRDRIGCKIELDALATRVMFDDHKRAIGVEYLKGERLYRAHPAAEPPPAARAPAHAAREVILAGGAFNTPQLLMLSGVGPRGEVEPPRHPAAGRFAGRGQEPPGPLRGRRRQPDGLADGTC